MDEWKAAYAPLLGAQISALAWCPLWVDTPGVVSELQNASFSFSGGVLMIADTAAEVFLTWTQIGDQFCLLPTQKYESCWLPNVLDRIHSSCEEPWGRVLGATVSGVRLYADRRDEVGLVVGARHELVCQAETSFLWIGTGDENGIGDHDDLWVSIGQEPPNFDALRNVLTFGA